MNEFKRYHPIVNFMYFVVTIVFTCLFMHPITLLISAIVGFTYSVMLNGKRAIIKKVLYMLLGVFLMAIVNTVFNHEGITILAYFPNGNPLTMESVFYGIISAVMIISVILQFSCFNEVMTSDKFIYLFGRVIPVLSLIFSMVLRFVPKFAEQMKCIVQSQKCVGRDVSKGGVIKRAKNGLKILSIMVTWSLENAIDTSDSMKARGYGLPGRTAFSIYKFSLRDKKMLAVFLVLFVYIIMGSILGELNFKCFPIMQISEFSIYGLSVFVAYFIYFALPILIELWEVKRWKSTK